MVVLVGGWVLPAEPAERKKKDVRSNKKVNFPVGGGFFSRRCHRPMGDGSNQEVTTCDPFVPMASDLPDMEK